MIALLLVLLLLLPAAAEPVTFTVNTQPPNLDVFVVRSDVLDASGRPQLELLCKSNRPHTLERGERRQLRVQFSYTLNGVLPKPAWEATQETVLRFDEAGAVPLWPEQPLTVNLGWRWYPYAVWEQYFWFELAGAAALVGLAGYFKFVAPARKRRRVADLRVARLRELGKTFDRQDPWLGRRLGAYRLVERLGAGGMAAVYRALDEETLEEREPVAVKVLHGRPSRDAEERFRREAMVCSRLNHPNLVRILDAGDQDGVLYLAMELVRGQTLRGRRASRAVVQEIFAGVGAAHSLGIVHRDLKPDNIMITAQGRVVVMDFGLARRDDLVRATATGGVIGTPAYMAPEQIRGEEVDARADQYSLGVMLYEMLAGALPFEGEPLTLLMKHLSESPSPLPAPYSPVMRMLEKQPQDRFPSLAAAWEALSEVVPEEDTGPVGG